MNCMYIVQYRFVKISDNFYHFTNKIAQKLQ